LSRRLVADIGGTNARFALWDERQGRLESHRVYRTADFPTLRDAVAAFLADAGAGHIHSACLAVAAPPATDRVVMTNSPWSFSIRELQASFRLAQLRVINDFEAIALALPLLAGDQLAPLRQGTGAGHLAVLGPGTGLGGAKLVTGHGAPIAVHCEPGEVTLGPGSERERELFVLIYRELDEIHNEDLLSGRGLERLYLASAALLGQPVEALDASDIAERATASSCSASAMALDTFCALLGSAAADFVLSNGAFGGFYLAGGIPPRIEPFLRDSDFLDRFTRRRSMTQTLESVPVYLVREPQPGLLGASLAPL
jgi:glucokinase